MNLANGRVLILKTSSMGDVVHALPAISDLRRHRPGLKVDWLVESVFAPIPSLHPGVAQVLPISWRRWRRNLLDAGTRRAIAQARAVLRDAHYDLVIDLQGLLKSVLWGVQAKAPMVGYDRSSIREPLASLTYRQAYAVPWSMHAIERCRRLVAAALEYSLPTTPPDFGILPPAVSADAWQPPAGAAMFLASASQDAKLWPEDRWIALGVALRERGMAPVVWWGNDAERARAERIAAGCGGSVPPFLTIADAAGALARARIAVGLDTGFSHLAAAFGVPTVGIYVDQEPSDTGVTGSAPVINLGAKGHPPTLEAVRDAALQVDAAWARLSAKARRRR